MRLRVGPIVYKVRRADLADENHGVTRHHEREIILDQRLRGFVLADTALHETVHVVLDAAGLNVGWSQEQEEQFVRPFASWLAMVLHDNRWLTDLLRGD
jgi:hypothetical protein